MRTRCVIRGRMFYRRNEVLAETGGAVSALTPREHTVLRQQIRHCVPGTPTYPGGRRIPSLATGGGKVRQRVVLLYQRIRVWARWILLFLS